MLFIGGWVSMWRPLEIFLYDWWPIREEARLSDRLAARAMKMEARSSMGGISMRVISGSMRTRRLVRAACLTMWW